MIEQGGLLVLNHLLADAYWARERLVAHAGSTARIVFPPLVLELVIRQDGTLGEVATPHWDVEIRFPPSAWLALASGAEALQRQADIAGSAALAQELGFVLGHLRWDAEEDLSRLVGDAGAHRLMRILGAALAWPGEAASRLGGNASEFLRDETGLLAAPGAVREFNTAVDELRDALARLDKRLGRLTRP